MGRFTGDNCLQGAKADTSRAEPDKKHAMCLFGCLAAIFPWRPLFAAFALELAMMEDFEAPA